ncbi:MAG: bifunctional 5,10-methylene-tetrahydrofolate dehydrogenase/5,10-methylene-tetrahydrofolate cyclohydrolase, partial [Chlamydiales bacterium]
FVQPDMVKPGAIVVDVGINRVEDPHTLHGYRLVGDVDIVHVKNQCMAITPVPKGVGPMTVAMLIKNTCRSL